MMYRVKKRSILIEESSMVHKRRIDFKLKLDLRLNRSFSPSFAFNATSSNPQPWPPQLSDGDLSFKSRTLYHLINAPFLQKGRPIDDGHVCADRLRSLCSCPFQVIRRFSLFPSSYKRIYYQLKVTAHMKHLQLVNMHTPAVNPLLSTSIRKHWALILLVVWPIVIMFVGCLCEWSFTALRLRLLMSHIQWPKSSVPNKSLKLSIACPSSCRRTP